MLTGMPSWLDRALTRLTPVSAAFVGSALLSLLAIWRSPTINGDGMLYVSTARIFLQEGFSAAQGAFAWPLLPILMAVVSKATGLGLENAGHFINILFMAGACAFLVASATRLYPEAAWTTCLVLLAIPGLNGYRDELIREYGCWFFLMLSFWLALRWSERPSWRQALIIQASLGGAVLFRPEAMIFFPALIAWQFFSAPKENRLRRLIMVGTLPAIGLATLVVLYFNGHLASSRIAADLSRISPARFAAKAQAIAPALFWYARDQAGNILFFGSLALIPLKFVKKMGPFIIPLLFLLAARPGIHTTLARSKIFVWAFAAHLLVLMVFVIDMQFVSGRYIALLLLLAVPATGLGFWLMTQRFPRWKHLMTAIALLIMVNNVMSFSPARNHYSDAGKWLAANATDSAQVYIESGRAAHYAGWRFAYRPKAVDRQQLPAALAKGQYRLVVLEVSRQEPEIGPWLESIGLHEIQRFSNTSKDAVVIAEPVQGNAREKTQDSAPKTERIREKTGSIE